MTLARRQLLKSLVAASLFPAIRLDRSSLPGSRPLHGLGGAPDWPGQVVARLAEKRIRTTTSPYKVSYARVSAGIMNKPEEIELVLREIRTLI